MIFLIDECLHPSLTGVAEENGHQAHHVAHFGMQSWTDRAILKKVSECDYVLVTNNAVDFRHLYARTAIHAGLILILPNVPPPQQRALFAMILFAVGERSLVNTVIEVGTDGDRMVEYEMPAGG